MMGVENIGTKVPLIHVGVILNRSYPQYFSPFSLSVLLHYRYSLHRAAPAFRVNQCFVRDLIMEASPFGPHTTTFKDHWNRSPSKLYIQHPADMQQHYRPKQRQYLQWRTDQGEKASYIRPHLRQLRSEWFAKRYTDAKSASEKRQSQKNQHSELDSTDETESCTDRFECHITGRWKLFESPEPELGRGRSRTRPESHEAFSVSEDRERG
ncbi:hypothetical protein P280DRAFT_15974 [Massarina eburnea CBS 473.64]|uniref:Uncharacterized protein n=1 Tax=Massarina eburnea CBS 473.64 TaxID=1395130 RepID=A0A6A6SH42_9PLEO|nr:hypothetical protein P280DRAFT_15974 [Massarina eburnea CBS 473.64]